MYLPRGMERIPFFAGVMICSCLLSGCGGASSPYQPVTGAVKFQGQPIDEGSIQFCTAGAQPVVVGGSMIRGGKYELPQTHGLAPGSYVVRITSPERIANTEKSSTEMMAPFRTRERIPAKYNTESELKIEVHADKRAEFDFDLK